MFLNFYKNTLSMCIKTIYTLLISSSGKVSFSRQISLRYTTERKLWVLLVSHQLTGKKVQKQTLFLIGIYVKALENCLSQFAFLLVIMKDILAHLLETLKKIFRGDLIILSLDSGSLSSIFIPS